MESEMIQDAAARAAREALAAGLWVAQLDAASGHRVCSARSDSSSRGLAQEAALSAALVDHGSAGPRQVVEPRSLGPNAGDVANLLLQQRAGATRTAWFVCSRHKDRYRAAPEKPCNE
jgi:hypothetical protein